LLLCLLKATSRPTSRGRALLTEAEEGRHAEESGHEASCFGGLQAFGGQKPTKSRSKHGHKLPRKISKVLKDTRVWAPPRTSRVLESTACRRMESSWPRNFYWIRRNKTLAFVFPTSRNLACHEKLPGPHPSLLLTRPPPS
jgi:hypothetical protein